MSSIYAFFNFTNINFLFILGKTVRSGRTWKCHCAWLWAAKLMIWSKIVMETDGQPVVSVILHWGNVYPNSHHQGGNKKGSHSSQEIIRYSWIGIGRETWKHWLFTSRQCLQQLFQVKVLLKRSFWRSSGCNTDLFLWQFWSSREKKNKQTITIIREAVDH